MGFFRDTEAAVASGELSFVEKINPIAQAANSAADIISKKWMDDAEASRLAKIEEEKERKAELKEQKKLDDAAELQAKKDKETAITALKNLKIPVNKESTQYAYGLVQGGFDLNSTIENLKTGIEDGRLKIGMTKPEQGPMQAAGTNVETPGLDNLLQTESSGGDLNATLIGKTGNKFSIPSGKAVSEMTMDELAELQNARGAGSYHAWSKENMPEGTKAFEEDLGSTPVGKYQFVGDTLKDLKNRGVLGKLGITPDTIFDEETQDKLFVYLAEERLAYVKSPEAKRLAMRDTWEGLKNSTDEQVDTVIAEIESGSFSGDTDAAGTSSTLIQPGEEISIELVNLNYTKRPVAEELVALAKSENRELTAAEQQQIKAENDDINEMVKNPPASDEYGGGDRITVIVGEDGNLSLKGGGFGDRTEDLELRKLLNNGNINTANSGLNTPEKIAAVLTEKASGMAGDMKFMVQRTTDEMLQEAARPESMAAQPTFEVGAYEAPTEEVDLSKVTKENFEQLAAQYPDDAVTIRQLGMAAKFDPYNMSENDIDIYMNSVTRTNDNAVQYDAIKKAYEALTDTDLGLGEENFFITLKAKPAVPASGEQEAQAAQESVSITVKMTKDGKYFDTTTQKTYESADIEPGSIMNAEEQSEASKQINRLVTPILEPIRSIKSDATQLLSLSVELDSIVEKNPQILTFVGGGGASLANTFLNNIEAIGIYFGDKTKSEALIAEQAKEARNALPEGTLESQANAYERWYAGTLKLAYVHASLSLDQRGIGLSNADLNNSFTSVTTGSDYNTYTQNLRQRISEALNKGQTQLQLLADDKQVQIAMLNPTIKGVFGKDTFAPLPDYLAKIGQSNGVEWSKGAKIKVVTEAMANAYVSKIDGRKPLQPYIGQKLPFMPNPNGGFSPLIPKGE